MLVSAPVDLGDFKEDRIVDFLWGTKDGSGASITRSTDGTVSVYKDNGIAESVAGVVDTEDFDGLTGIHACTIDLSDAFYAIGANYSVVLSGAVIDTQTVNAVLAHFSIENRDGIAALVADEVLTGATHNIPTSLGRRIRTLQDFGVYEGGSIWINTSTGAAGTVDFENCTVSNPGSNLPDALVVAGSVGLARLHFAQGSSVAFVQTMDNYELTGLDYIIDLGGQQVDNTTITGAVLFGTCTGNGGSLLLERCKLGPCNFPEIAIVGSALVGPIVLTEVGIYFLDRCASAIAGAVASVLDFGAVGAQEVNIRHHSGGVHIKNMAALDTVSLEGHGQLVIDATCSGGDISIRGHFSVTDDSGGAVTVTDDARFNTSQLPAVAASGNVSF